MGGGREKRMEFYENFMYFFSRIHEELPLSKRWEGNIFESNYRIYIFKRNGMRIWWFLIRSGIQLMKKKSRKRLTNNIKKPFCVLQTLCDL